MRRSLPLALMGLALCGCQAGALSTPAASPCMDGGDRCAASRVPPGLRAERHGWRIGRFHWVHKTNREAGVPDVGLEAEWQPIQERL